MYVADHLSRAYLKNQDDQPHDEFQVFALELEEINPLDTVKITSERLAQLQKATEHDPVMQTSRAPYSWDGLTQENKFLYPSESTGISEKISHCTMAYSLKASALSFLVR